MTCGSTHEFVDSLGLAMRAGGHFIPSDEFLELATALAAFKVKHRHESLQIATNSSGTHTGRADPNAGETQCTAV